ncbi:PREDICTED: uncharacterized protein LOC109471311 [Branchiostoma belcheri]|uniref:Uncharacterized protein LOC109471311 n=1 Tax=Branchiostoma belcheri TaxID=7741 RepID=A0A6P4YP49_BRABE|nr:PREDICTED: uncharacterized protein LOC109471311 [Branchiostoma belcheri]
MAVVETSVGSLDLGSILQTSQHNEEEEDRIDCLEQQLCELQSWFSAMEARLDVSGLHAITCLQDVEDSLASHQAITEQIHDRQRGHRPAPAPVCRLTPQTCRAHVQPPVPEFQRHVRSQS